MALQLRGWLSFDSKFLEAEVYKVYLYCLNWQDLTKNYGVWNFWDVSTDWYCLKIVDFDIFELFEFTDNLRLRHNSDELNLSKINKISNEIEKKYLYVDLPVPSCGIHILLWTC